MKVVLCEFEDSFTYNIFSELRGVGLEVEICPLEEVKLLLESNLDSARKLAVVLGPGPGHPDERIDVIDALKKIIGRENFFLMGVCLGHQLIARALGLEVRRCSSPRHGEVETIPLEKRDREFLGFELSTLEVQRYNSLASPLDKKNLKILKDLNLYWLGYKNEIYALGKKNLLTYQFHPESVGTSFRSLFFKPLKSFLL